MVQEVAMSEHTAAIFANRDASDDPVSFLERLGFSGLELRGPVDADEAGSINLDGVAIACHNGWTVVYNTPDMFGSGSLPDLDAPPQNGLWPKPVEKRLIQLSLESDVLSYLMEGSTGTYGLAWYVGGKRLRLFLHHHQKVVFDEGKPLDSERPPFAKVPQFQLEMVFMMLAHHLVGDLFDAEFQAYDYTSPPGSESTGLRIFRG
jgi:hypothetical protein